MTKEDTIITEGEWKPSVNPWVITSALMLAVFIFAIDGTIANVALPHMAGSFSASHDESTWILTSYLIASGIVIPSSEYFNIYNSLNALRYCPFTWRNGHFQNITRRWRRRYSSYCTGNPA